MSSPIAALLKETESETLEFKSGRAAKDAIARVVCGMLNQRGGIVLWGVDEEGNPIETQNTAEREKELNDFIMRHINPRPFLSISVHEVGGKAILAVEVPMGTEKPYSLDRIIWVRVGTATMHADTEQSSRLVESSATNLLRWERETMPGFSVWDCDREELAFARKEIAEKGRFGIDVPTDIDELLVRLYLARSGQLTNAAAVLFARDPRTWAPNLAVRLVSYASDQSGPLSNDVLKEGPAIRVLKEVIEIIQQRTGASSKFDRNSLRREDQPAYALYALREGLVNAMVHRNYDQAGQGVKVEIFLDRLVITNPGRLPDGWTERDLARKHESHPSNPDIARVFYLRGLMEQLGLGTQRVIEECKKLKAKPPTWEATRGVVILTLYAAPEPEGGPELTPRQKKFLKAMLAGKAFKVPDYMRLAAVSERQARRDLVELERLGVVNREGAGPATLYRIPTEKE
jgi:ATP-dependent DNA helicase RecG